MSQLFSNFPIGPLTLSNRIVIPPMCQYSCVDGEANDWHLMHWGSMLLSGAGLLMLEATAVVPEGRITHADLGLYNDATEQAMADKLQAARRHSTMPVAIQLSHAGRKASCQKPWEGGRQIAPSAAGEVITGWQTAAPSALPYSNDQRMPIPLDEAELQRIVAAFVASAQRSHRLGIEAIELHMAHGYLLHQFLSPLSNQRSDRYGGSLENRLRFPLAVFDAVRAAVPATVAVGVRISATDWVDGGWDVAQSVVFGQALRGAGCDFIHVSSGGLSPLQKMDVGPNYQVALAEQVRHETGLPTIAVGLITEPEQAEAIIADGRADFVALARGMLYNPRWPWHAAAKLGAQVAIAPQYLRCQPHGLRDLFTAAPVSA